MESLELQDIYKYYHFVLWMNFDLYGFIIECIG